MGRRIRRGVRARRVVRRLELWSVAKVAFVFHLLCYALTMGVLIGLWWVAYRFGLVKKLETFLSDYGFADKATRKDFVLKGDPLLRAVAIGGVVLVGINTVLTVVMAFFYNGVSGLFGGLVVSVLEERPNGVEPDVRNAPAAARISTEKTRRKKQRRRATRSVVVAPPQTAATVRGDPPPLATTTIDLEGSWLGGPASESVDALTSESR